MKDELTETTLTLTKVEVENIPQPSFVYETQGVLSSKFNATKQEYILTQSAKLGINPNIVVEQTQFIDRLKAELTSVRAESRALREQIAREIEADHKPMTRQTYDGSFEACQCGYMSYPCQLGARAAAIARSEK